MDKMSNQNMDCLLLFFNILIQGWIMLLGFER